MDAPIALFNHGVENLYNDEVISQDAAQDSMGFFTQDGSVKLLPGRALLGADAGITGQIRGLHFGYTSAGALVLYRKTETTLDYLLDGAWSTILTGLTPNTEASFANYSSLAGAFTFFATTDGFWKINNAFPSTPFNMYNEQVNFHGRILIDRGRMLLYKRIDPTSSDFTGIYGSHIDTQTVPYYTAVSNKVLQTGDGATKTYSGTVPLFSLCNMFGLSVWAPTGPSLTVSAITNELNAEITTSTSHNLIANDSVVFGGVKSGVPLVGTGTVSISGNYGVTGVGTAFTTQLKVGARIFINATATVYAPASTGGNYNYPTVLTGIVQTIDSDTALTVQLPFKLQWGSGPVTIVSAAGASFTFSSMSQLSNIPCLVTSVIDATHFRVNVDSTHFDTYSSGETVNKAEVLIDNRDGTLSSLAGATGTINYMTGAYTFNFVNNVANAATVVGSYFYENSNNGGVTDFTYTAPRVAGEGFMLPQDKGGDPIMLVLVGQDGSYYSLKKERAYKLTIGEDDVTVTNEIYYEQMGLPSENAGIATSKGIVFMNIVNPTKPEMTLLVKNLVTATLLPEVIFPNFKFADYDYSDAYFSSYERYVIVSCKKQGSLQNDTILLCNLTDKTVDISPYEARMFAQDYSGNIYAGSSIQPNVYQIWNGFDDLGYPMNAWWTSAAQLYAGLKQRSARWRFIREILKKFRKVQIAGMISLDQSVAVDISYDDSEFQQIGTISGRGSYVNAAAGQYIGGSYIGSVEIGGAQSPNVFSYRCEIKLKNMPKFRKRVIRLRPLGIGYFDFNFLSDYDIMLFEARLPAKYRSKQNVSLDGTQTDLP